MPFVVDASVLVGALADPETDGERARRRLLEASELNAPCHVDLEVLSALARAVRRRLIDSIRATSAVADLGRITLRRYPVSAFVDRAWALRDSVTLYDAAYVALAEVPRCAARHIRPSVGRRTRARVHDRGARSG